ncbi:MAG: Rsd/AlgQ family anti-sigma factor [Gammaproteobacteria bacterium]|nr:Rsd/AlgQ family anti-sigma factor [Gammaproteobacteria bacterium]
MNVETATQDRRKKMLHAIDELIAERNDVLVSYSELAKIESPEEDRSVYDTVDKFCALLIDYTALGQFEIFGRIIEGKERREDVRLAAEQVYPKLLNSTDVIIAMNEKYDLETGDPVLEDLHDDLSRLGEAMAERFEAEDFILTHLSVQAPVA